MLFATLKDFTIQFADGSEYLTVIVAMLSLLVVKKNTYFRLLSIYLFVLSALNLATRVTADYNLPNWYMYHIIGFVEPLFVFLLYRLLGLDPWWKWVVIAVLLAYVGVSVDMFIEKETDINSVGEAFGMLLILILGFNFLWKLYQEEKVENLGGYSYFYISTGFTFFAAGSFFGYLLISRMSTKQSPDDYFCYSWVIVSGFVFIKLILIAIGILVERRKYVE